MLIIDMSLRILVRYLGLLQIALVSLSCTTNTEELPGVFSYASSGPYLLRQCGSDGQPGSQALIVKDVLATVRSSLEAAIADTQLGTSSTHGFTSFFKSDNNKAVVQDLFNRILQGPLITLSPSTAQRTHRTTAPPTFVCSNEGDPHTEWMYNSLCQKYTHSPAGQRRGSQFIVLCPLFFRLGQLGFAGPPPGFCPILIDNKLSPNNEALTNNQLAVMIHELVHLYGPTKQASGEAYSIQDAIDLNATASMANAANFAFYVAAIAAGCTTFPPVSNPKDELRS